MFELIFWKNYDGRLPWAPVWRINCQDSTKDAIVVEEVVFNNYYSIFRPGNNNRWHHLEGFIKILDVKFLIKHSLKEVSVLQSSIPLGTCAYSILFQRVLQIILAGTCDNITEELGHLLQAQADSVLLAWLVPLLVLRDVYDIEADKVLCEFDGPIEVVHIHDKAPVDRDSVGQQLQRCEGESCGWTAGERGQVGVGILVVEEGLGYHNEALLGYRTGSSMQGGQIE